MLADRVKETSTTTGTGSITLLGAVAQFTTFASRFAVDAGATFHYAIVGQSGSEWEVGLGYLSASSTLVRDRVFSSSNSDALVSFAAGTKDVFVTFSATAANATSTIGQTLAARGGWDMPS